METDASDSTKRMPTYVAVVGVILFKDKILFLKRNPERKFAAGKWEFISGRLKDHEPLDEAILREAKEETGLDCTIQKIGEVVETNEPDSTWILVPFLLSPASSNVIIGHEHTAFEWIDVKETNNFDHVSGVEKVLVSLGLV